MPSGLLLRWPFSGQSGRVLLGRPDWFFSSRRNVMTTEEVIAEVRRVMSKHQGSEKDLLNALCTEADGWEMRLDELDDENDDEEEEEEGKDDEEEDEL